MRGKEEFRAVNVVDKPESQAAALILAVSADYVIPSCL